MSLFNDPSSVALSSSLRLFSMADCTCTTVGSMPGRDTDIPYLPLSNFTGLRFTTAAPSLDNDSSN